MGRAKVVKPVSNQSIRLQPVGYCLAGEWLWSWSSGVINSAAVGTLSPIDYLNGKCWSRLLRLQVRKENIIIIFFLPSAESSDGDRIGSGELQGKCVCVCVCVHTCVCVCVYVCVCVCVCYTTDPLIFCSHDYFLTKTWILFQDQNVLLHS